MGQKTKQAISILYIFTILLSCIVIILPVTIVKADGEPETLYTATIKGKVGGNNNKPIPGVQVHILPKFNYDIGNGSRPPLPAPVTTDANGYFEFTNVNLPQGDYKAVTTYKGVTMESYNKGWFGGGMNLEYTLNIAFNLDAPGTQNPSSGGSSGYRPSNRNVPNNQFPVVVADYSWKRVEKLAPVQFNVSESYDPDGQITKFYWEFGDGRTGEGPAVEHAYAKAGTFRPNVYMTDDRGATRNASFTVIVSTKPPVAVPGESRTVYLGEPVELNGTASYDPDGSIVKYEWFFGDGTYAEGENVTHFFDRLDTYKVDLRVTDDDGVNSTSSMAVRTVVNNTQPEPVVKSDNGSLGKAALLLGAGIATGGAGLFLWVRKRKI